MPEEKWTDRLKRSYNENPIAFMGAAAMLASGAAKLIDSMSGHSLGPALHGPRVSHEIHGC